MKIRKSLPIAINILLISSAPALADPPADNSQLPSRVQVELCRMSSEAPHISMHVRGTMNASGRTVCWGTSKTRQLIVKATLTRHDGGNTPPITITKKGIGSVIVNIAMPCIWQTHDSLVSYTIVTIHKLSNGKIFHTENEAEIKC